MTRLQDMDYGAVSLGKGRMYLNRPRPHRLPVSTFDRCIGPPELYVRRPTGEGRDYAKDGVTIGVNTKVLSPLGRLEGEFDFAAVGITKPLHDGRSTLQHLYTME